MRTISCKLEDLKTMTLHIGYEGENDYTSVRIDAGSVFAQYPEAVPSLKVQPPKGNMYPVIVTRDGDIVIWNVSDSDTASNGNGEIQLTFTENTVVVKSCTGKTLVHRSLKATGPAPDPLIDFIDRAEEVVGEAQDAAEAAEAAAQHAPMIGLDGYWYKWDAETEGYVKTDTKARGEDGANGVGITSVEKISTVGLVDTYRINFTNGTNTTYTVTNGQDGSVPIDDTTPAANKVFSSAKVDEELTGVKNDIQGLEDNLADTVLNITPEWDQTMVISEYGTLKTVISGGQVSPNVKISKPIPVKKGDVVSITGKLTNNANIAWTSQEYLNTYQGTPSFLPLSVGDSVGTRTETATVQRDGYIIVSAFTTETCTVQITRTYKSQQEENAIEAIDPYLRHNYVDTYDFVPNLEKKRTNSILTYQADDKSSDDFIVNAVAYPDGRIIACRSGGNVVRIENDGTETVLLTIPNAQDWRGLFMDSNLNVYVSPHSSTFNPAVANTDRGLYRLAYGENQFVKVISLCHDICITKWAKNTAYSADSKVFDNNTSIFYICKTAHTSGNSIDLTKFDEFPAWKKNTAYAVGDPFKYRNVYYLCKTAHTSGSSITTTKVEAATEYIDNDDTIWTMCEDAQGNLYAGVYAHSMRDNPSVYVSYNKGVNWFLRYNFITCGALPVETYSTAPQHVHCINYNEYDRRLYAAVGEVNTILYSDDKSVSWVDMHIPCVYGQPTYVMGVKDGLLIGSDGHYSCGVSKLATDGVTLKRCGRTAPGFIFNIRRSDVTGWLYAFTRIDNFVGSTDKCPPVEAISDASALESWKADPNTDPMYLQWWTEYNEWASVYYPEDAIRPQHSVMMVSKDEGETWEVFKTIKCSQNYASICGFITVGYFRDGECLVGCLLPVEGTQNDKAFVQPFVISEGKKKRTASGFDLTGEIFIKTNTSTTVAYE